MRFLEKAQTGFSAESKRQVVEVGVDCLLAGCALCSGSDALQVIIDKGDFLLDQFVDHLQVAFGLVTVWPLLLHEQASSLGLDLVN